MLWQIKLACDLTDGAECVGRLVQSGLSGSRYGVDAALSSPSGPALMRCLRIADGLNTITRRGEIGTSVPVFGLRPMRWPFLRTTKEPNEESFTVSPRSRQSVISFNTSSTSADDSVRDRPTFWYTASHRSARVTVFPVIAQPQSRQRSFLYFNDMSLITVGKQGVRRSTGPQGQVVADTGGSSRAL